MLTPVRSPRSPALRAGAALLLFSFLLALTGCPDDPSPPSDAGTDAPADAPGCTLPFIGDKSQDIVMEVIVLGASNTSTKVSEGDMVPMIFPPQGGEVIFAGVRAKNIDPCGAKISGALRDLGSNLVQVDARTVNLEDSGDGWGQSTDSDIASFSNISVCPNNWSKSDIYGHVHQLEVTVTDRDKRSATSKIKVTPFCAEEAYMPFCTCTCKEGYILGETCDGGAGGGGSGGSHP